MRRSDFGSRIVMPLTAAFSLLMLESLTCAGPALAAVHAHHHHFIAYRHHLRQHHRYFEADYAAPDLYAYAPASFGNDSWNEPHWHENQRSASSLGDNGPRLRRWRNEERSSFGNGSPIDGMAASAASAAGIPVSLVERVIKRESGGNPRAVSRGNYGLMQIRLGTARAMGYSGGAAGLLDAQTNMTYAVRYLAGAYRAAGGNESRAVALYARGYSEAKTQGFSPDGSGEGFGFAAYQPDRAAYHPQFAEASYQEFGQYPPVPFHRLRHHRHHAV